MSAVVSISGFTFLRNAVDLGYPFVESIRSLLPLVDEFVIALGRSSDDTLHRVRALAEPKIRIIETVWNERMAERGFVYAQQKMIAQYACLGDWAFYLEADEVLHEDDLAAIRENVNRQHANPAVEALVFDYLHFYGSPDWLAVSPAWYRRECRLIRNTIRSYAPDGQYWVVMDRHRRGRPPRAALAQARIFHYGHARPEDAMQRKLDQVSRYWRGAPPKVDYTRIDARALAPFCGSHPAVMRRWLDGTAQQHFAPANDHRLTTRERKHRLAMRLERWTGLDLSHKHYRLVA